MTLSVIGITVALSSFRYRFWMTAQRRPWICSLLLLSSSFNTGIAEAFSNRSMNAGSNCARSGSWSWADTEISSETLIIRRADAKPLTILGMNVEWLRAVDGFRIELSQEALNDGSVKISVKALDPLPEVNKGFYGKVVLTTNVEEEPTIKIDLLGVIQLPRKGLR